ncbi:hypothetical protein [Yoonia sp.]|uniref:hypothetical protein n=1 Tax=Yoonia sp. TaxID=2212373 RepID=UPI00358F27B3
MTDAKPLTLVQRADSHTAPAFLSRKLRTDDFRSLRRSMSFVTNKMAKGDLDAEFARGLIWALQQCSRMLEKEIEHERLAGKLAEIEALLRQKPEIQKEVDLSAVRAAIYGEEIPQDEEDFDIDG